MSGNFFDDKELLSLGISLAMVETLKEVTRLENYVTLSYAGNPNNNVTSNASHLCVDTSGSQMYYNPDIGVNTGWVAV